MEVREFLIKRSSDLSKAYLLQDQNGPCLLLAIVNALAIRGDLFLTNEIYTDSELITMVSSAFNEKSTGISNEQFNEMFGIYAGLIDVGFSRCDHIAPSLEVTLLKGLSIPFVHGWLPEDEALISIMKDSSFDELQLRIANSISEKKTSSESNEVNNDSVPPSTLPSLVVAPTPVAESAEPVPVVSSDSKEELKHLSSGEIALLTSFFEMTTSQLTPKGISELLRTLGEDEPAVFFRNNHFSTIMKHNGEIYVLATDISFKDRQEMWEKLIVTDGDTAYYSSQFDLITPDLDSDYALALALQNSTSPVTTSSQRVNRPTPIEPPLQISPSSLPSDYHSWSIAEQRQYNEAVRSSLSQVNGSVQAQGSSTFAHIPSRIETVESPKTPASIEGRNDRLKNQANVLRSLEEERRKRTPTNASSGARANNTLHSRPHTQQSSGKSGKNDCVIM